MQRKKRSQLQDQAIVRRPSQVEGLPQPHSGHYRQAGGWLLLLHAVLFFFLQALRRESVLMDRIMSENTLEAFVLAGVLTQFLLIFLPSAAIIVFYHLPAYDLVGGKARAGSLVLAVTVGIPAAVVFQGLNNLLIYGLVKFNIRLPQPTSSVGFIQSDWNETHWLILALILLVAVILPGILEELMFRGILQASLRSTGAVIFAVFWQAAAFALFHADPLFMLPPLLAGLLLGYIRLKSESLLPAILAHMSLNISLLAITPLLPRLTGQYIAASSSQANSLLYASLIAACIAAVAFVPLIILLGHQQTSNPPARSRPRYFVLDWRLVLALLIMFLTTLYSR